MEVGAVKQAFNNEVIFLKKKLNQAKIHVIHKLTRKAKTLLEKKSPEHLKEKLKRKAESAVKEVLLIKKIKAKDLAKFMITHTGEVKDYLNRPIVDNDKACARLVLHKSLEDKYTFFRSRFGNVPIKDLFLSRIERRKIKQDAKEQQKNKKKGKKSKAVNAAGDWDVEDVEMGDDSKDISDKQIDEGNDDGTEDSEAEINEESADENAAEVEDGDSVENSLDENHNSQSDKDNSDDEAEEDIDKDEIHDDDDDDDDDDGVDIDDDDPIKVDKYIKLTVKEIENSVEKPKPLKKVNLATVGIPGNDHFKPQKKQVKEKTEANKKVKENKNKNLKEKLQNRKFKKDEDYAQDEGRKVVDPFFITASGGNYLSLAEPRQPDEVKEVHRHGNRKERRAVMFGHAGNIRPKRDNFRQNKFRTKKFDGQDSKDQSPAGGFRNNSDKFKKGPSFDRNNKFNDRNSHDNRNKFNDGNSSFDRSLNNSSNEKKDEKLHPSWEAKKKLKSAMSLLPAQGKKIVFNDN